MIQLRHLKEKDIPLMLEWMHDPEINQYFRFDGAEMSQEKARCYIADSFSAAARHYAVCNDQDEYLGTVSLEEIDLQNKRAMYAISMRACAHGSGAAQEATNAILHIAFDELDLNRVYLNVLADNTRACRFYEKFGFRYEGCFHHHLIIRGQVHDWNWYAMLKEDFNGK